MNSSRFRPELYRVIIHPFLSITSSTSGVLAVIWMIGANVGVANPRAAVVISAIVAAILEAVVGNILYKERAGIGNRIRELVIFLIILYGALSLVRSGPFGARFLPSFDQILPILSALFTWIIAFLLHDRLRGREALLRTFGNRNGAELRRAILDRQHDMALTVAQLRKARALITSIFVIACALAIFASLDAFGLSATSESPWSFVILIISGITTVTVMGTINAFIEEYAANGEGLAVPLRFQRRRFIAGLLMLLLVLTLAFALSRRQAVLPIEAIGDFFRWLGGLFQREREAVPDEIIPPPPIEQQQQLPPELLELLENADDRPPPLWLRILGRLIERLGLLALIIGGALLLFGPLFSQNFRAGLADLHAWQKIKAFFRALRQRMRILGRFLRSGMRRRGRRETEDEPEGVTEVWRASQWKPSLRKRRQMDRVVQVFADLTRWGGRKGVTYSRPEAVREYVSRLSTLIPEHYQDAMTVAETFCEARFSQHLVPRSQMREYVNAAKRIMSAR